VLDWYTGLVGYDASNLRLGELRAINRSGEVEWVKDRPESVMGSFQSKVLVGVDSILHAKPRKRLYPSKGKE
jgi:hypothetical protein